MIKLTVISTSKLGENISTDNTRCFTQKLLFGVAAGFYNLVAVLIEGVHDNICFQN